MGERIFPAAGPGWARELPGEEHVPRGRAVELAHRAGSALAAARGDTCQEVSLTAAVGRVTARDVQAACAVPHYASSAMDGYAVSGPGPWRLSPGDAAADDLPSTASDVPLAPGTAVPVVTGGVIPRGTTTVVREEFAARCGDLVELAAGAPRTELAGRHIRPAGTECAAGEVLLPSGTVVSPAGAAFAAVAGADVLAVRRAPRVAVLLTGSEVLTEGIPGPGRVRDAFSMSLPHVVTAQGGSVGTVRRVPDHARSLRDAFEEAATEHDLVLTTGGTARSRADLVRPLVHRRTRLLVDQLDLQPGHPTLLGAGEQGAVLALPGNPLGAVVALILLGGAFTAGFLGLAPAPFRPAVLGADVAGGRAERLVPARRHDGLWQPCRAVGSNMLRGLTAADALLAVPPAGLRAGESSVVLALPW
ncbi:molybdopterin molybdotransferase MoeA [Kocuria sp.]|uniref:molybdopterin molybdotransferase MoeA n=1 Tax=Kocuria sp. TaxID=1871328 RepID=UPI0026DCD92C|nr:molybdopterin molybdotransferase MoeA [Kocuria sp.]MDO4918664.1 molybdopterin molybdotransferase MoeA [Kocuria sp.]